MFSSIDRTAGHSLGELHKLKMRQTNISLFHSPNVGNSLASTIDNTSYWKLIDNSTAISREPPPTPPPCDVRRLPAADDVGTLCAMFMDYASV